MSKTGYNRWIAPITAAACCLTGGLIFAEKSVAQDPPKDAAVAAAIEVSTDAMKARRKDLVARYLRLTDEEAKKFWPIYDSYQKDLNVARKRNMEVLYDFTAAYPDMTNEKANEILSDFLNNQKNILDRQRTYVGRFEKAIPNIKILRLYQLENRMDSMTSDEIAAKLPLVPNEANQTTDNNP